MNYKCYNMIEWIWERLDSNKKMHQKSLTFVIVGILKILVLSMNHIFAIAAMT